MKVFVYGTLLKGEGNHRLLENSKFVGKDSVIGFKIYNLGYFPACVPSEEYPCVVFGEVYEISNETLSSLDRLEGYPRIYNRKEVNTFSGHTAFIYYMDTTRNYNDEIKSGDWLLR